MRWIIFYADGSTFSGEPGRAPKHYVQVVMQETANGRDLMDQWDHYCWHNDRWIPHDKDAVAQYLDDPTIIEKIVLDGYWIADESFWKIHNTALSDPEWKELAVRIVRPT